MCTFIGGEVRFLSIGPDIGQSICKITLLEDKVRYLSFGPRNWPKLRSRTMYVWAMNLQFFCIDLLNAMYLRNIRYYVCTIVRNICIRKNMNFVEYFKTFEFPAINAKLLFVFTRPYSFCKGRIFSRHWYVLNNRIKFRYRNY